MQFYFGFVLKQFYLFGYFVEYVVFCFIIVWVQIFWFFFGVIFFVVLWWIGEVGWFQFIDGFYCISCEVFFFCFKIFDGNEFFGVDDNRVMEIVMVFEDDF